MMQSKINHILTLAFDSGHFFFVGQLLKSIIVEWDCLIGASGTRNLTVNPSRWSVPIHNYVCAMINSDEPEMFIYL